MDPTGTQAEEEEGGLGGGGGAGPQRLDGAGAAKAAEIAQARAASLRNVDPDEVVYKGDVVLRTQRVARREAFRRNNIPTSLANNYTTMREFGKNENIKGPNGEPYETIEATDLNGRVINIPNHNWGHFFTDVTPNVLEGPHFLVRGVNIFYTR